MHLLLALLALAPKTTRHAPAAHTPKQAAYIENLLTLTELNKIRHECSTLRAHMKREKNSIAVKRTGLRLPPTSESHKALTSPHVARTLARAIGEPLRLVDFPIELRHYGVGAFMDWHTDDLLTTPAQLECIFTVENTADSFTQWRDLERGFESMWTTPNSLLVVRAGADGPQHRVTPVRRGGRTILKLVFAPPSAQPTDDFYEHIDSFPEARKRRRR